jgi:hypothetical protein
MASFKDESLCSTENLLNRESSSFDLESEQWNSRASPSKGLGVRIFEYRLAFLVHLALIAAYMVGFSLMLENVAKHYEHGLNLVNCEIEYWLSYVVSF